MREITQKQAKELLAAKMEEEDNAVNPETVNVSAA